MTVHIKYLAIIAASRIDCCSAWWHSNANTVYLTVWYTHWLSDTHYLNDVRAYLSQLVLRQNYDSVIKETRTVTHLTEWISIINHKSKHSSISIHQTLHKASHQTAASVSTRHYTKLHIKLQLTHNSNMSTKYVLGRSRCVSILARYPSKVSEVAEMVFYRLKAFPVRQQTVSMH